MSRPLVSLCMPTWNRAASLAASLVTTCGQDYDPIEIIISDNGSTDDTERICREAAARDPRIRYIRHERNIGLYQNHNYCMDAARGDFICFFHDHDEREIGMVRRYVEFMVAHPEVGIVSSDRYLLDQAGRRIGVRDYKAPELMTGLEFIDLTMKTGRSTIGVPGAMIRRSALGSIRLDEAAPIGFGDFIVWFQIAEHHSIGHLRERLWSWTQDNRFIGNYGDNSLLYFHQYQNAAPGTPLYERARTGTNVQDGASGNSMIIVLVRLARDAITRWMSESTLRSRPSLSIASLLPTSEG